MKVSEFFHPFLLFASLLATFFLGCKKESNHMPIDIDGNIYDTVHIGQQHWMAENLKTTRYRNGDSIFTGYDDYKWTHTQGGAYSYYYNIPANDDIYGKLYNWYAVNDPRGICPEGWHVPSDIEWLALEAFLGGGPPSGAALKSTSNLWFSPNTGATNSSGFNALPAGERSFYDGDYNGLGYVARFWSSKLEAEYYYSAIGAQLSYNTSSFYSYDSGKTRSGYSCRCLED